DELDAVAQLGPEVVEVGGPREAPRHANDGDRTVLHGERGGGGRYIGALPFAQEGRQSADGRVPEEVDDRQLAAEYLQKARLHADHQHRVAAQVEEVVAGADP